MLHCSCMSIETQLPNLQRNIILAPYTTYKIGGPADYFIEAHSQEDLITAITLARRESIPYFLLGTGANILIGDKGFRGLVVYNRAANISIAKNTITAESGATIAELIQFTTEKGLSGLEHFAGIPSSVGGALWQNLHFLSPDRSRTMFIEEVLQSATVMMMDGSVRQVGVDFFEFGYDDSILHHQEIIVLEATFALTPKSKEVIMHQAEENLPWRRARQPQLEEFPSCGSVFKKIEAVGAGRLIDQVGLKGKRIGGAKISEKHANFLVNTGNATAADVVNLATLAQQTVKSQLGYELEMEIRLVGEFA